MNPTTTQPAVPPDFVNTQYGEAALWWLIAGVFLLYATRRSGPGRRRCRLAAAAFAVFGLTDVIEAHTGAWWRPWWLVVVKALCLGAMAWLLFDDFRHREPQTQPDNRQPDSREAPP